MGNPFLCGVTAAWALAQMAMGISFAVAHLLRRDVEQLLFGLLCFSLAVLSCGVSTMYGAARLDGWRLGVEIVSCALIVTVPLHLHFVLSFARIRGAHTRTLAVYALSAVFLIIHTLGLWRIPGSEAVVEVQVLGLAIHHVVVRHQFVANLYYVFAIGVVLASVAVILRELGRGRPGSTAMLMGGIAIGLASITDVGLLLSWWTHGFYTMPHAFLFYSFAIGLSLLFRQREAAGRLEITAKSLQERTEELRRSYQDLRVMEDELGRREQLAAVGELAATIAHEVRNPLAVISNAAAGLRRSGIRSEDRQTLLSIVDEEVARLNRLVTDLLRFARPVSVSWSDVDLRELAERLRALAPENVVVLVDIPDDPRLHTISVDAGLLRLVLENLVENACQAMPDGGTLTISVRHDELDQETATCLEIKDTGRGMDERTRERALKPFFTTRPQGTGLGLPIVDRIVRAHGGAVVLHSAAGEGTRVCLLIPVDKSVRRRRRSAGYATNSSSG